MLEGTSLANRERELFSVVKFLRRKKKQRNALFSLPKLNTFFITVTEGKSGEQLQLCFKIEPHPVSYQFFLRIPA